MISGARDVLIAIRTSSAVMVLCITHNRYTSALYYDAMYCDIWYLYSTWHAIKKIFQISQLLLFMKKKNKLCH